MSSGTNVNNDDDETFVPGDFVSVWKGPRFWEPHCTTFTMSILKAIPYRVGEVFDGDGLGLAVLFRGMNGRQGTTPVFLDTRIVRRVSPLAAGMTVLFAVTEDNLSERESTRHCPEMIPWLGRAGVIDEILTPWTLRVRFDESTTFVLSPTSLLAGEGLARVRDLEIGSHVQMISDLREFSRLHLLHHDSSPLMKDIVGLRGVVTAFAGEDVQVQFEQKGMAGFFHPATLNLVGRGSKTKTTIKTHAHALYRSTSFPAEEKCAACRRETKSVVFTCGDGCALVICSTCEEWLRGESLNDDGNRGGVQVMIRVSGVTDLPGGFDKEALAELQSLDGSIGFVVGRSRSTGMSTVMFSDNRVCRSHIYPYSNTFLINNVSLQHTIGSRPRVSSADTS